MKNKPHLIKYFEISIKKQERLNMKAKIGKRKELKIYNCLRNNSNNLLKNKNNKERENNKKNI